jgi:hypothetical protein
MQNQLTGYSSVSPELFDLARKNHSVRDEHEFLESRYYNFQGKIIAKVVRYLDEDGELKPHADLMLANDLI